MEDKLIKYLGIDWGKARLGLALADSETKIATPFKVVKDLNEIMEAIKDEEIDVVVVGKPYQISNIDYPISIQFINFISILKKKANLPIKLVDERLSSKAADQLAGNKKTKASRDAVAAMLILQSYLDRK